MYLKVYALRDRRDGSYIAKGGTPATKPTQVKVSANRGAVSQTRTLAAKSLANRDVNTFNDHLFTELGLDRTKWNSVLDERYQARCQHYYGEEYENSVEYYKQFFEIVEATF